MEREQEKAMNLLASNKLLEQLKGLQSKDVEFFFSDDVIGLDVCEVYLKFQTCGILLKFKGEKQMALWKERIQSQLQTTDIKDLDTKR